MKKTVILIMLLTIITKLAGFGKDIILAYYYGASITTDVYIISLTIPTVVFAMVGKGLSTGFIPMYSKINQEYGRKKSDLFTNNLVNLILLICLILWIFGFVFAKELVLLFASGFEGETLSLAIIFTRISMGGLLFTGLGYIFGAYLNIQQKYVIPTLIGLPFNLIVIISIFLSYYIDLYFLAFGSVVAIASQLILMLFFLPKTGYKYKFVFNLKDKNLQKMLLLTLPVILGSSIDQVNKIIDRTLASNFSGGGISVLEYAQKLNGFVLAIFVLSITTVLFPKLSKLAASKEIKEMKHLINQSILGVLFLIVPTSIAVIILAEPIIKVLFGRGAFDTNDISLTASALLFYSIGMIGVAIRDMLSGAFYALQDTKTPMINASISLGINIILNILLSSYMGLSGLALATSISALVCSILMIISLRKKIGALGATENLKSIYKVLFSSISMGIMLKYFYGYGIERTGELFALIFSIITAGVFYITLLKLLKFKELEIISYKLFEKINLKKKV